MKDDPIFLAWIWGAVFGAGYAIAFQSTITLISDGAWFLALVIIGIISIALVPAALILAQIVRGTFEEKVREASD